MVDSRPDPSLVSIQAFEAAARCGSFAGAARELGTSAASVSYHVKQLEQHIGVRLFERQPHRVALTAAGTDIAQEALTALAALRASFVRAREMDEHRLSVTTLPTLGTSWLTPRLGRFRSLHPTLRIDLELSPTAHDLAAGAYDVAIRNGYGRWPGLRATLLFPSIFMPLCAPSLATQAGIALARPGRDPAIPLLGRPDWWEIWYRALGRSEPLPAAWFGTHLPDEHLDAAAAAAGHGLTIGSPILFADDLRSGRLVPAHGQVAADGRSFWLAIALSRLSSSKVQRFAGWLADEARAAREEARRFIGAF